MLSQKLKDRLKANWGDKANALAVYAEVKLIDPLSSWSCYLFSMDENEEFVQGLFYSEAIGHEVEIMPWNDIQNMFNEHGNHPVIDTEYRPMRVTEILRRLRNDT